MRVICISRTYSKMVNWHADISTFEFILTGVSASRIWVELDVMATGPDYRRGDRNSDHQTTAVSQCITIKMLCTFHSTLIMRDEKAIIHDNNNRFSNTYLLRRMFVVIRLTLNAF